MQLIKRMILLLFTATLVISGSVAAYAQSDSEAIKSIEKELEQKSKEKESINKEIELIQQEIDSLNTYISKNKETMETTLKQIEEINQLIEKKKEEIVVLEDKILSREDVMKKRLVALQHDSSLSIVIKVLIDSKDFNDFIQRATAVSTLMDADKDILEAQQSDLEQIEKDKKEIDKQQQILEKEQKSLTEQQDKLNQNLQKRQDSLTVMQEKFKRIDAQMILAKEQKSGIEAKLRAAQEQIRRNQAAMNKPSTIPQDNSGQAIQGQELYVTATAYSPEESGSVTKLGYNIRNNPNMKLIAVDPSVIPLGKKVWVEGYGTAIAGDTGSAIVGHKIDVLMPTKSQALSWGRKTVKIVILN